MSLDCDYEEIYQRPRKCLVSYLVQIGTAKQSLSDLIDLDVFDTISKHNSYWDSEHTVEAEKLEDARLQLNLIYERLSEIMEKLD